MIRFTCECGNQLQAQDESAGRHTACPECGRDLLIPDAGEAIQAVAAEASREDDEPGAVHYEFRPSKTSGKGIASLVLGIASFLCSIFTGIPALILGIVSLVQISRSHGRVRGQALAIGGIVTGALGSMLIGPALMLGLLLPAVQKVRVAANRAQSANNLKMIGLAMYNYRTTQGSFPPAVVYGRDSKPLYSWRVLLLPYLQHDSLYKQFRLDEPWDGPNNLRLLSQMPTVYQHPSDVARENSGTVYQVIVGKGAAFEGAQGLDLKDFPDGTSNTILVVEAAEAVPWTKPQDLAYAPDRPLPRFSAGSSGGFNALFADGSVHAIPKETKELILRALITRNGGEALPPGL